MRRRRRKKTKSLQPQSNVSKPAESAIKGSESLNTSSKKSRFPFRSLLKPDTNNFLKDSFTCRYLLSSIFYFFTFRLLFPLSLSCVLLPHVLENGNLCVSLSPWTFPFCFVSICSLMFLTVRFLLLFLFLFKLYFFFVCPSHLFVHVYFLFAYSALLMRRQFLFDIPFCALKNNEQNHLNKTVTENSLKGFKEGKKKKRNNRIKHTSRRRCAA